MHLKSLEGCRLKIGSYPPFSYNACGGGGIATLQSVSEDNLLYVNFSSQTFSIPPLVSQTTKFLYLPLPPGLKIEIHMDKLEGTIKKDSGEILFKFESKFTFSIGNLIKFPYLQVKTSLTTGRAEGTLHKGRGIPLQKDGKAKLVGISTIPQTGSKFLDTFLGLPNEALAELKCEIK